MPGVSVHVAKEWEPGVAPIPVGRVSDDEVDAVLEPRRPLRVVLGDDRRGEHEVAVLKVMIVELGARSESGGNGNDGAPGVVVIERARLSTVEPILELVFEGLQEVVTSI